MTCPKCKADLVMYLYRKTKEDVFSGQWLCEPCETLYHVEKITRMGREVEIICVVQKEFGNEM